VMLIVWLCGLQEAPGVKFTVRVETSEQRLAADYLFDAH